MAFREIYKDGFQDDSTVQHRLRELIEYMKWKSGWEMVEVYQHYFKAIQYADTQDGVHARLDEVLKQRLTEREQKQMLKQRKSTKPAKERSEALSEDPDFDFLRPRVAQRGVFYRFHASLSNRPPQRSLDGILPEGDIFAIKQGESYDASFLQ